jgi:hypothetical protein
MFFGKEVLVSVALWSSAISSQSDYSYEEIENIVTTKYLKYCSQTLNIEYGLVKEQIGQLVLRNKYSAKGSVGIISKGRYVVTKGLVNSVIVNGETWVGKSYESNQVLFIEGDKVSESMEGLDADKLLVILFTPSEIRFVDYSDNSGGRYLRRFEKSGVQEAQGGI